MITNCYTSIDNGKAVGPCKNTQHFVPETIYLIKDNFLSEFRTALEKAKVRANLGIADSETLYWGNIQGDITRQTDIAAYIDTLLAFDFNVEKDFIPGSNFENVTNVRQAAITCLQYLSKFKGEGAEIEATNEKIKNLVKILYGVNSVDQIEFDVQGGGVLNKLKSDVESLQSQLLTHNTSINNIENQITTIQGDIEVINKTLEEINNLIKISQEQDNALVMKEDGLYVKDLSSEIASNKSDISTLQGKVSSLETNEKNFLTKDDFGSDDLDFVTGGQLNSTLSNYVKTGSNATLSSVTTDKVTTNKITSLAQTIQVDKPLDFNINGPSDPRTHVKTQADMLSIDPKDAWKGMPVVVEDDAIMYILTKEPTVENIATLTNWKSADSLSIEVLTYEEYKQKKTLGKLNPGVYYYIIEDDVDLDQRPVKENYIDANGNISEENEKLYFQHLSEWLEKAEYLQREYMSAIWGKGIEARLANKASKIDYDYLKQEVENLKNSSANNEQLEALESKIIEILGEQSDSTKVGRLVKVEDGITQVIKDLYATDFDGNPIEGLNPKFVTWEALGSEEGNLGEGESLFVKTTTYNQDKENLAQSITTKKVILNGLDVTVTDSVKSPDKKTVKVDDETLALESDLLKIKDFDTHAEYLEYVSAHESDPDFSEWYFVIKEVTFGQQDEQLLTKGVAAEMIKMSADTKLDKVTLQNLWAGYYNNGKYTPLSTIINDILSGGTDQGLENVYNLQQVKQLIDAICEVQGRNDNNFRENLKTWINAQIIGEGADATSSLNYVPNTKYAKDWEQVTTLQNIVNSLLGEGEDARTVLFKEEQAEIPSIKATEDIFTIEQKDSSNMLLTVKESGEVLNSEGNQLGYDKDIPYIVWCDSLKDYQEKVTDPITDNPNNREVFYIIKDLVPESDKEADNCYMTLAQFKQYAVTKQQIASLTAAWEGFRKKATGSNATDQFGNQLYNYQTLSNIVKDWLEVAIPGEVKKHLEGKADVDALDSKVNKTDYEEYQTSISSQFIEEQTARQEVATNLDILTGRVSVNEESISNLQTNKLDADTYNTNILSPRTAETYWKESDEDRGDNPVGSIKTPISGGLKGRVEYLENHYVSSEAIDEVKDSIEDLHNIYDNLYSVTYENLKTLVEGSKLIPGAFYRITDYQTTVNDSENYEISWNGFNIIVRALSTNSIDTKAHATSTFYPNANSWKLEYTLQNVNLSASDGKGTILKMVDEKGNTAPFDFKSIKIKKYKITKLGVDIDDYNAQWTTGLFIGNSNSTMYTILDDFQYVYTFSTETYQDASSLSDDCKNNEVANIGNIIFGGQNNFCSGNGNAIYKDSMNNNIQGNYNLLGERCSDITTELGTNMNILYSGCSKVAIKSGSSKCVLYDNCQNVNIGVACEHIQLAKYCNSVTFQGKNSYCVIDLPYAYCIDVHYESSKFKFVYDSTGLQESSNQNKLRYARIEIFGNSDEIVRTIVLEDTMQNLVTTFYLDKAIVKKYFVANQANDIYSNAQSIKTLSSTQAKHTNELSEHKTDITDHSTRINALEQSLIALVNRLSVLHTDLGLSFNFNTPDNG